MTQHLRPVGIVGLGTYVPERVLTNADLEKMVDTSDEWIVTRTGIRERRIAAPHEATSDLATHAAQRALEDARLAASDIELIVLATLTPDMLFPATANIVQHRLGATHAGGFDLSAGCSGFVYALAVGAQFVATGVYQHVLVIGADTLSRIVDWTDRSTCVLFGDGAGAAVLGPAPEGTGFLSFVLGSDGGGADLLNLPAGGSRKPASADTVAGREHFIRMAGNEVFKFGVRAMVDASLEALEKAGLQPNEVDLLVPHQANIRIMDAAARRLDVPLGRVFSNVDRYGNTSAASVPLAFDQARREGRVKDGANIVFVGFGAGLTWAATVLRWSDAPWTSR
ncbi:MAG: beta-ketoacyl-ACP synthase III [Armatimonadota bacterium]|nr:beta-ketoacyl-ACP synthase III [Armatimonadota bacterium]